MTISTLDLQRAVNALWVSSGLDWSFKKYWNETSRNEFLSLNEIEAMAATPMPYCVYEQLEPNTTARMTKATGSEGRREFRDSMWMFKIYARVIGVKSAKHIAGELADEILKIFGGHPTVEPQELELQVGSILNVQYQNDFGKRMDDRNHQWMIRYLIRTDVPVAI